MSVPNKSLDKNKRYAGVKANDFVNKTRENQANRSAVRPQGWANLGKINSRRIPPPANLPSLKSETGVNPPTFDPTITTNHGWTSNDNSIMTTNSQINPTQQQLDSLPVNSPTPPSSADIDKSRIPPTWSNITAGTNLNPNDQTPNLLGLNDFPRLATATTTQDRKSQSESITNIPNPTFRPTNLATWKEGGSSPRIQSLLSQDLSQMIPNNPGANLYQQQNMRMYTPQMWNYNQYPPVPLSMHQQRVNNLNDYKSPTILRHKDIDDLSKITDNTWANASQEVNYEEKIRFSDDEDIIDSNTKPRRINNNNHQILSHTRLIHDDEHLKQMQDNKNSELINTLNIAKQRRDEQERHLKNEQFIQTNDEHKPIPGYQTRPLLTPNEQENFHTSRLRHDTNNSQSSFTMKSWSDQMDSFNYSSLHEKSHGHIDNDDILNTNKYSRSPSETSSQSPYDNKDLKIKKTKKPLPLLTKKFPIKNLTKKSTKSDQWENWNESSPTDNHRQRQQLHSDDLTTQKSNRYNKQTPRQNNQQQSNSRSKQTSSAPVTNKTTQPTINNNNHKSQPAWRPLSPNRSTDPIDPTPQESISYKSQQRTNDHKQQQQQQRYQTIDTSSIPPLMSVRSDATATAKLYKTANHTGTTEYYDDENLYYDTNLQTHQRFHHTNLHNRGYTALGSYGRYRRSGTVRHQQQQQQQQYSNYNMNNTSGSSSTPNTTSGTRQKKNLNNKKPNQSSEQTKTSSVVNEINSSTIKNNQPVIEEIPAPKPIETPVPSPDIEKNNGISDQKPIIKLENETNITSSPAENQTIKSNKKTPTTTNTKRRTNKDQQNYQHYQTQQAPRHRNNYNRSTQDYDTMQMASTHNYYGTNRRNGRNNHMHDLSSGYYYEQSQQHYNNRYNYSNDQYHQRSTNKTSKRGDTTTASTIKNRQRSINGNNNNNNHRHHSISDNDLKEGEEWETASESSTNMRNGHYDNNGMNNQQTNDIKSINNRGRTPPKKSFSSQRPNARQIFKYTNA